MRVSTSSQYDDLKGRLIDVQSEYYRKQQQIGSGKEIQNRSEDPIAGAETANILRQAQETEQFIDNVDDSKSWSMATQNKVQNLVELLQKANELTTTANNGTHPSELRQGLGEELDAIIEQVFEISESKFAGVFLFSGTDTGNPPLTATRDADGRITSAALNSDADTALRKTQINENSVITYGDMIGGTDGLLIATGSGVDVVANLIAIRDELLLGNAPVSADVTELEDEMDHVIGHLTTNGVTQQWLESQGSRLIQEREVQVRQLEQVQSADLAASMTELAQLQTTYQATMQMINSTNSMSILNYL